MSEENMPQIGSTEKSRVIIFDLERSRVSRLLFALDDLVRVSGMRFAQ